MKLILLISLLITSIYANTVDTNSTESSVENNTTQEEITEEEVKEIIVVEDKSGLSDDAIREKAKDSDQKKRGKVSVAEVVEDRTIENIAKKAIELLSKDYDSNSKGYFKVSTKRLDKKYPKNSSMISKEVADIVLPNFENFIVDLRKPEITLGIEFYAQQLSYRKKHRVIADYIASMSDRYALNFYNEMYGKL